VDQERKKDLSIFYWLVDLFSDASYINVVDGFPQGELVLPTVAVEYKRISLDEFELGNLTQLFERVWFIEVFAINKSQRDDIGYRIIRALQNPIPVYDYDEGFPPAVSPTKIGALLPRRIKLDPVIILPEITTKLYYRAVVSFEAVLNIVI
jgi:hypothetical protein